MKKTLVAMAAIAATASFAQSSVTISGNLDVAYSSATGTLSGASGNTFSQRGTSSTTGIKFTAAEDIGGGMKVTAQFEFDPRGIIDDTATQVFVGNSAASQSVTAATASTLKMIANHEMFIGLSGGFGNLQLGMPNSFSLTTHGVSSPLGTGIGAGYTANGAGNSGWSRLTSTRYTRSAKYTSPNMNGFTVGALYAPGNDQAAPVTGATTTALSVLNNRQVTELAANYSKGNLNVSFTNVQQASQTNALGYYQQGTTNVGSTNANVLAANYKFGNLTAYAGMGSGRIITPVAATSETTQSQSRYALKYNAGNIDLIGQYTQTESHGTTAKYTGARIDYNLSKTAAAYLGYESYDSGSTSNNQLNLMSVGLRKSF